MKIAAFYARVSTPGQEKEATIESQIAEIEERAKQDGNIIGQNFRFIDDGWTSELLARPALDLLRDAVKNKAFEILYVYDLGRLSRIFLYQLILKKEITEAGIQIISLHDINAVTPETKFAQDVMGLFHDYERIKIAERFRRGKLYRAKNGVLFGWQAPYGYKYIKGKDKCTGYFEIVPHEAEVIKTIFTWVGKEGLTIRQTIKRLFERNLIPRKSKRGFWSTSTLSRRLRDETYIGTTYYNKSLSVNPQNPLKNKKYKRIQKSSRRWKSKEDWYAINKGIPVIIDKNLFEAVQKQLILNSQFCMRNKKHDYLLSTLIFCTCGRTRAGEGNNNAGQWYYRCTDRVRTFPLPKVCDQKGINSDVIDNEVWKQISRLLTNPDLIKKQAEIWVEKQKTKSKGEEIDRTALEKDIESLAEEEKRYLKAYGEGIITFDKYKELSDEIKLKKAQVMNKINQKTDAVLPSSYTIELPNIKELCDKMSVVLRKLTFDKKRTIVRKTLESVTTDGQTAKIKGYIPLTVNELTENKNVEQSSINRHRRTA